mmetsp:Transcript_99702/g.277680  ORF Transcript_99702/g.277680 Transcript_99702/m.277680 type:complete len:228 (+) Transcript_99702:57-740(+)
MIWPSQARRSLLANDAAEGAPAGQPLHTHPVRREAAHAFPLRKVVLGELREAKLAGDVNLLATCKLELCTPQRLRCDLDLLLLGADGDQHLANVHPSRCAVGLAEGAAHPCGEAVSTGARQGLVDTEDVEWVRPYANVEEVSASICDHVLVCRNARRLHGLTGDLLVLIADHVHCRRELLAWDLLLASVKDPDLRVWNTTDEARLRPSLALGVAVALRRTATHGLTV